jgi:hypothetical protein
MWKKLSKLIPDRIQIKPKSWYDVVYKPAIEYLDNECHGLTDFDKKLILMNIEQSSRLRVVTYLHEVLHAFSYEYKLGLSEKQILQIEKALYYVLKENNIFKEE